MITVPSQQPFTTPQETTACGIAIRWQDGPKTGGVNGATPYDVIRAAHDRLGLFQAGPAACEHNREAMAHLVAAMAALDQRTADRFRRGVTGKQVP